MAERIRGLQIDIGLNDMGINRKLSEIKRSFRTLNTDLKLSRNNFVNSEKSMTSYKNRIRELDGSLNVSKKNLEDLRKQYEKVSDEQGHNSKAAQSLRQEISRQADTQNYLQKELDETVRGFKEFQKQQMISNSNWTKTGNAFTGLSKSLQSISGKLQSTGKSLTNSITKPAMVAGGALAGITLTKGWSRLVEIDNAKAKLDGLGHSGQNVQKIMDNALESVKGTLS